MDVSYNSTTEMDLNKYNVRVHFLRPQYSLLRTSTLQMNDYSYQYDLDGPLFILKMAIDSYPHDLDGPLFIPAQLRWTFVHTSTA